MSLKTLIFIALGFGFAYVSKSLELMGDLAPVVKGGISAERATYHLAALLLMLAALGSFLHGGLSAWRSLRS